MNDFTEAEKRQLYDMMRAYLISNGYIDVEAIYKALNRHTAEEIEAYFRAMYRQIY